MQLALGGSAQLTESVHHGCQWRIGPRNQPDPAKLADLFVMLALRGDRDRTEEEFPSVLDAADANLDLRLLPVSRATGR